MDATDLARWTRFAAKGGIGKCTAVQDCVAQGVEDLMFLKDDEIVVLLQLSQEDEYLGYCEGVVGRFHGRAVQFHGKLKKPVFAKRQSTIGSSPSRPISSSPRSPPPGFSGFPSTSAARPVTSPTSSPLGPSLPVPSPSDGRTNAKHVPSSRLSVSSSTSPTTQLRTAQTHDRMPSNASSVSHYSTHSRSLSQSQEVTPTPFPPHLHNHARKASSASSRSAYSSNSRPPSRTPSHSESMIGSGSEDTHTQHVALPPPLPATQAAQPTPALTDGSSAHSSVLFSPTPAFSSALSHGIGKAPASLFQGRARSGSEKLSPRTASPAGRRRSGSENTLLHASRAREDEWVRPSEQDEGNGQIAVVSEEIRRELPASGLSESSFQSVSVYSDASAGDDEADTTHSTITKAEEQIIRHSVATVNRGILKEDESEEEQDRRVLSSSPDDLSDGGFGIGMTLLREDDDEDSEEEPGRDQGLEEKSAFGHIAQSEHDVQKVTAPKRRTLGMRVMNPGSVSPSTTESESESERGDDTVIRMPIRPQTAAVSEFLASSSADTVLPISGFPVNAPVILPRPPFATHGTSSTIGSMSSLTPTDDEHWESDADIYDDYRYSRYSTHYSGSPAQHSSRRASRGSTKSGRSRASERPPLPDEESWKKTLGGTEGVEESMTPQRKSLGSERSSVGKASISTGPDSRRSVLSASTTLNYASVSPTPFTRGAEIVSMARGRPDPLTHVKSRTPSPSQGVTEVIMPATPGAAPKGMTSLMSPLTRAFRRSEDSKYSRNSEEHDEADDEGRQEHREETPVLATRHLPSPGPDDQRPRSRSPALATSIREKIENERRTKSPNLETKPTSDLQPQLSVVTSRVDDEPTVIVLNESPVSAESPRSLSSPDGAHLRVDTPQSYNGSTPPSPLNPGFPPSPSTMASFAPTPPLSINKSPSPAPSNPRQPVSPPAIPFTGVPPPGRPPAHMQYVHHSPPFAVQQQRSGEGVPTPDSLYCTILLVGQHRATTLHGHTQTDLLSATGPVPISFMLPGVPPPQPPPGSQQGSIPRPQPAAPTSPYGQIPPHAQESQSHLMSSSHNTPTSVDRPSLSRTMTVPAPPVGSASASFANIPPASNSVPPSPLTPRVNSVQVMPQGDNYTAKAPSSGSAASPTPASPLPRANFFPQVGQVRPRSRSFSGFNSDITEMVSQTLGKRSQEEGSQPFRASAGNSRPSSPSSKMSTQLQPASLTASPVRGKPGQPPRPSHGPSPLSLPPTTSNVQPSAPKSPLTIHNPGPTGSISRVHPASVRPPDNPDTQRKRGTLRQTSSHLSLRPGPQASSPMASASSVNFPPQRRNSGQSARSGHPEEDELPLKPPSPIKLSAARQSHESDRTHNSSRSDRTSPPPFSSISPSSSPLVRSGSLRSKISMSALKSKGGARSIRDGASETVISTTAPSTPPDEDTVQIKDMEFELVRPTLPRVSSDRGEESADSKDVPSLRALDLRQDSSSVRSEALSPGGLSPSSGLPGSLNASADSFSRKGKPADASTSVQAHRDRELKWISTMNTNDAAQAKKSKKVKKLLIDGVPSSVRYLVWAHISNSGSKKMPNVYAQLSKRRPTMAHDIERDVELSFPDHPHLRDPKGPLVSVLFAYIAMVPDLRYHRGLAIIAGHLLLQSPEEDAFWTFLAMMDSYLRPYFMPASAQMSVDTNLFVKAVEAADQQLATRVFAELNVRPQELCGVWFSSVFAGTLPLEHLHRVWDLFLYEGVPFLFRVGLTILLNSRRYLLESSTAPPASYTGYLLRPPPDALPADPEQFIAQALTVKLKDDDIRKSRIKMEAAVKQQQQQRTPRVSTSQPSHPHLQGGRVRVS